MGQVAMNLVATMMQKSFSNYQTSFQTGSGNKNFSQILSIKTSDNSSSNDFAADQTGKVMDGRVEKTLDRGQFGRDRAKIGAEENFSKINRNPISNDNPHDKVSEIRAEVKEVIRDKVEEMKSDMKNLEAASKELLNEVAKELDMNPDEVMDMLNELNMTILDLFDMDNMKLFLTEAMGLSDPMELMTTDGGVEKLAELLETVEVVKENNPDAIKVLEELQTKNADIQMTKTADFVKMLNNFQDTTGQGQAQTQTQTGTQGENAETAEGQVQTLVASGETTQTENTTAQTGFEGVLTQVVTQKTETFVMNGNVMTIRTEVTAKDVFDQIVTGMKVNVSDTKSNVLLQLNPQHLGKIGVQLTSENGVITGHFVAESEAVKEVIEANLSSLKAQLQSQGIDVSEIKITVGNASEFLAGEGDKQNASNNNQNSGNKKHGNAKVHRIFADKISSESPVEEELELGENSSIELHA